LPYLLQQIGQAKPGAFGIGLAQAVQASCVKRKESGKSPLFRLLPMDQTKAACTAVE
jgi:hypothetical protein